MSGNSPHRAAAVEAELRRQLREQRPKKAASPGIRKMTAGQKAYAWRLLYDLAKLSPSAVPVGERMAGIVRKVLQEDPCPGHPLNWVKREDGAKLIEALKRYLRNAKRKAAKAHDSG
ncbi:MAG: phage protein GemA/Gp16 family protein [Ruminococcus sp.]